MKRPTATDQAHKTAPFRRRRRLLPNCNLGALHIGDNPAIALQNSDGNGQALSEGDPRDAHHITDHVPIPHTDQDLDDVHNENHVDSNPIRDEATRNSNGYEDAIPDGNVRSDELPVAGVDSLLQELAEALQIGDGDESDEDPQDDDDDLPQSTALLSWTGLFSLICVCGSVRLTASQHDLFRLTIKWCSGHTMPSYRTVRRKLFPFLREQCFPASKVYHFPIGDRHIDNATGTPQIRTKNDARVRIVFPTEWAKLDVITSPIYESMRGGTDNTHGHCKRNWTLEFSDILRRKADLLQPTAKIFLDDTEGSNTARKGEIISITTLEVPIQVRRDLPAMSYSRYTLDRGRQILQGEIGHVWCANVLGHPVHQLSTHEELSHDQTILVRETSEPHVTGNPLITSINGTGIYPGDICALINPHQDCQTEWMCVLVHRFCTTQRGSTSRDVVWIRRETEGTHTRWRNHSQAVLKTEKSECGPDIGTDASTVHSGTLQNGEKYFVYRILLYADDFETRSDYSASGSNGGCYMIPMNLPPCNRRSRSAIRTISVTPPGVSTNRVIQAIIPDLVKGTVEGVEGVLPTGEKVRIFLDVLGFVGDYPASSHVIDSMTHTANAPCTLCNFKRFTGPHTRASKYGYTVTVNANNSSALRCGVRHETLRASGIDDDTAKILGMTRTDTINDESCPLIAFQRELSKHRNEEIRNSENKTIVTCMFDAYRSNLVAPDHLLTGLAKNILSLLIELTPTELRSEADIRICDELRRNGLIRQRTILKSNGKGLASMSLSSVFCTLLVSVPVFHALFQTSRLDGSIPVSAISISQQLRALVSRTYWTPQQHIDGHQAVSEREENGGETYLTDLRKRAIEYIQHANRLCTMSAIATRHLDKPNLHRLLELYTHTLPAFGHVSHFMELVFETAHQPLKRCIVRGNHKDDHLAAVEHSLGNDWQARLMLLHGEAEHSDQSRRQNAMRGLRRILTGETSTTLESEQENSERDQSVLEVFIDPIMHILRLQSAPMNLRSHETGTWQGRGKSVRCEGEIPNVPMEEPTKSRVLNAFWNHYLLINPFGPDNAAGMCMFKEMTRRKRATNGDLRSSGSNVDVVGVGDTVQVLVNPGTRNANVITTSSSEDAIIAIYCVICLIDDGEYGIVAGVMRCEKDGHILRILSRVNPEAIQLLPINNQARKIGTVHACHKDRSIEHGNCKVRSKRRDVIHNLSILEGGSYYYMTRERGYPPRMA